MSRSAGTDPLALTMRAFTYARLGRPELAMDSATRFVCGPARYASCPCGRAATPWLRPAATTRRPAITCASATRIRTQICAFASLGDVRLAQGELDAAIAAYRRHQEATPKYGYLCAAQADFGWARARSTPPGKPDEALAKFAAAAKRDPDDAALWRAWAAVLEKQGKKVEAAAKLDEARAAEARLAIPVKLN